MNITKEIQAAADHLDATRHGDDTWTYFAAETRQTYVVDFDALDALGARLLKAEREAYSLWCAKEGADCLMLEAEIRAAKKLGARDGKRHAEVLRREESPDDDESLGVAAITGAQMALTHIEHDGIRDAYVEAFRAAAGAATQTASRVSERT